VDAAVDVGVLGGLEPGDRIDDGLGLLAGGRVVQVDEGLSPNPLTQDGEVFPDPGDVKRAGR
jgi:hypothetical protein